MVRPQQNPLKVQSAYQEEYQRSLQDPESFWLQQAKRLDWIYAPTVADRSQFEPEAKIRWFEDGKLNVCYNCVDRHLPLYAQKTALIFEPDEPGNSQSLSYQDLYVKVCKLANILKSLGVQKGDIVTLYLPMVPELIYAMLACARIGAVHSVVFSGFSAESLAGRLIFSQSKIILTQSLSQRGGRTISLEKNVNEALKNHHTNIQTILLMDSSSSEKKDHHPQALFYKSLEKMASDHCDCVEMSALDPLFILYTSGSTGKPKGVLHSSGGYLVYVSLTHQLIFDLNPHDIYFCTADIGWITGHSYGVYGPLSNGSTLVLFQGIPTYPDASRYWKIIDEHNVSLFYTAPTALRSLMRLEESFLQNASLKTLRILASVGEPIDPATWEWFYHKIGHNQCPIMDTWWQTETGGILICPLLQNLHQKPSCAAKPFFGIIPSIINEKGVVVNTIGQKGHLCIKKSWPGQALGILGDSQYFQQSYFSTNKGYYTTGDGAKFDQDNDIWILGRIDDVLNVSGHRLNSVELEQAVMSHTLIAEACIVGIPHDIKGQGIFVFAVPHKGITLNSEVLSREIKNIIREKIGPIATPDHILIVQELPKTRSGKIVRRLLRKIASGDDISQEDTSILMNPKSLQNIQKHNF